MAENGWQELQPTIRPRWFPGGAVAREYIFVCGLPSRDRANLRNADKVLIKRRRIFKNFIHIIIDYALQDYHQTLSLLNKAIPTDVHSGEVLS